jgi:hypothetical protein
MSATVITDTDYQAFVEPNGNVLIFSGIRILVWNEPEMKIVAQLEDPSAKADGDHVNALLLRVVDLKAFKDAVGQVHAGVQGILKQPMAATVTQSPAVERPVQRPRP